MLESLESRTLMAVSLDANGFTNITPSADGKIVYVSNTAGNDANSGSSASSAVKSIAKGALLLRNGSPDWLLLKSGDVWREAFPGWNKSGRSADEPMVIGAYGEGDRPWIKAGAKTAFYQGGTSVHDVAVTGLHFEANTRNPDSPDYTGNVAGAYGVQILGP